MSGKKFRFSLQSVLELREYETEQARHQLQATVQAREEQEQAVQRAEERLKEIRDEAPDPGRVGLRTLRQHDAFRQHAQQQLQQEQKRLRELEEQEAEARAAWIEHRQAEESLNTLHDKEQAQHQKDQSDAELAFIDEQSVMRYNRSSNRPSLL